jgi:GNAT superfamily N-acetyltransferase
VAPVRVRDADAKDKAFIVEMARLASTIEDRPLPPKDAADVISMLPGPDDYAVVALDEAGRRRGAAWCSIQRPPLFDDDDGNPIPEIAIAVVPDARGQGIGTALIEALALRAARKFDHLALNVHLRNPAARLYTRTEFVVAGAGRGSFGVAMRRHLKREPRQGHPC